MSPLISGLASVASLVFNAVSSGSGKSATARRSAEADAAEPSAVLNLSPEAATLAGFADKGILVSQGKVDGVLGAARRTGGAASSQAVAASGTGAVSKKDFQELLTQFGATDVQKEQLADAFDVNKDGNISHDEFLRGLARTRGAQSTSEFSQSVMQLMDRAGNADGTVGQREFAAFSSAFATAEKRGAVRA